MELNEKQAELITKNLRSLAEFLISSFDDEIMTQKRVSKLNHFVSSLSMNIFSLAQSDAKIIQTTIDTLMQDMEDMSKQEKLRISFDLFAANNGPLVSMRDYLEIMVAKKNLSDITSSKTNPAKKKL